MEVMNSGEWHFGDGFWGQYASAGDMRKGGERKQSQGIRRFGEHALRIFENVKGIGRVEWIACIFSFPAALDISTAQVCMVNFGGNFISSKLACLGYQHLHRESIYCCNKNCGSTTEEACLVFSTWYLCNTFNPAKNCNTLHMPSLGKEVEPSQRFDLVSYPSIFHPSHQYSYISRLRMNVAAHVYHPLRSKLQ